MSGPHDVLPPLPLTGERTVPNVEVENYWFQRHVVAYRHAATRSVGRRVVDAGSGEGYGSAMLGQVAASVTGIELVPAVVDHARRAHPDQTFVMADICDTGLPDAEADVVVTLQVIEHLPDVGRFLTETRRILRPGGQLIVATPNRLTFSPHGHQPVNVFHVEEFTAAELNSRLTDVGGFAVQRVLGLHHGPRITAIERVAGRPFTDLVLTDPAGWAPWLRSVVRRVTADDFVWREEDLDTCLDLLLIARRPVDHR
ncbi:MAG TPA: class I SAM-dependent methyltransferase [Euzebya sp.]|nr:class I SAM-dependent methyltransferase [Euzebya sp.]